MDWNYIQQFHRNPPDNQLLRHPLIQNQAIAWMKHKDNINVLKKELMLDKTPWVITPNKFPYHFIDKTKHLIFWSNNSINYDELEKIIQENTDFKNYIFFENKKNNKSIPEIHHAHIFII
tara:strand:- start:81 stop:440 length:360 start_codon:yes stop_codon:yes gene_type:complete